MPTERITAIFMPRPTERRAGTEPNLPQPGSTMRLRLERVDGDDLLVRTDDGQAMRLVGHGRLLTRHQIGEFIQAQVLANSPRLSLSVADANTTATSQTTQKPAAAAPQTLDTAAMRADQLAMRQVTLPSTNAVDLAASWRAQLLANLEQKSAPSAPALPMALLAQDEKRSLPPLPGSADRWLFPLFGWGGLPVMLRLLEPEPDDAAPGRRPQSGTALYIEFELPGAGRVAIQVQLAVGGIFLTLAVEREPTMRLVREALPQIAAALAAAELRLRRCTLIRGLPGNGGLNNWTGTPHVPPGSALSPPLFRAATEVMQALLAKADRTVLQ